MLAINEIYKESVYGKMVLASFVFVLEDDEYVFILRMIIERGIQKRCKKA